MQASAVQFSWRIAKLSEAKTAIESWWSIVALVDHHLETRRRKDNHGGAQRGGVKGEKQSKVTDKSGNTPSKGQRACWMWRVGTRWSQMFQETGRCWQCQCWRFVSCLSIVDHLLTRQLVFDLTGRHSLEYRTIDRYTLPVHGTKCLQPYELLSQLFIGVFCLVECQHSYSDPLWERVSDLLLIFVLFRVNYFFVSFHRERGRCVEKQLHCVLPLNVVMEGVKG